MTDRQIKCFIVAAKNLSISKTADELFMVQSAVSRQVIRLEEELGVKLFHRSGRRLSLTAEGRDYYDLFSRLGSELTEIKERHASGMHIPQQAVRYSIFPVWSISDAMRDNASGFHAEHPQIEPVMKYCGTGSIVDELRCGNVDLVFHVDLAFDGLAGFEVRQLVEIPHIILYSDRHPLADAQSLDPTSFKNDVFLYALDDTLTRHVMDKFLDGIYNHYGFRPKTQECSDIDTLCLMLESRGGVALMDYWSRPKQNKQFRYVATDIMENVVIACREGERNEAVRLFVDHTIDFFRSNIG